MIVSSHNQRQAFVWQRVGVTVYPTSLGTRLGDRVLIYQYRNPCYIHQAAKFV